MTLALALLSFRPQLAAALIDRADSSLGAGDTAGAMQLYRRAAWFFPSDPLIAERMSFAAYLSGNSALERSTMTFVLPTAMMNPDNAALWMNVGLCELRLRRSAIAAEAFAHAGLRNRDVSALTLAGWSFRKIGNLRRAKLMWHTALRIDPTFGPARRALAGTGEGA